MQSELSFESICATMGEDLPSATRALTAPIYQTSVFDVESLELVDDLYQGRTTGYIYSRDANPNVSILEKAVAQLEGGDATVACSSGMAAIGVTLLALLSAGDHIVAASELYGGTNQLIRRHLSKLGITADFVDVTDLSAVQRSLESQPRLVFLESMSNPLLKLTDIAAIAGMAHERGVRVVVDNTIATPFLLRPLSLGADVVLHSATKYLGGHSDVTGGVVVASADLAATVRRSSQLWGTSLAPFAAWLVVRGMRTLSLRMERACANALEVARYLSDQAAVNAVYYPGLADHPQHQLAQTMLQAGFGGIVSFELAAGGDGASAFVKALRLIRFAPSMGEVRTTLSHPAKTSHRTLTGEERAALGISDGLIRLSCGIEAVGDIITDIDQALKGLYLSPGS
jgi:cystathionine beta-lyase/cystathionine gamma-synthase